jgi:O-antigen chain-terminating methyltransferase
VGSRNPRNPLQELQGIDNELAALQTEINRGEPQTPSPGLKGRLGSMIKTQLYRFLWWQNTQIRTLIDLILRRGREETALVELVLDCKRQTENMDLRIQQLESAQLKLQREEMERNVQLASLEKTLAAFSELDRRFRDLAQQLDATHATRIGNLERGLQDEMRAREQLHGLLAESGAYTHQTRAILSLQERRLSMFIEEARKRLPEPFTQERVDKIVEQHENHKYDSVYQAFEDAFRGSREEIKTRVSTYIPLLNEHRVGSEQMPVLDVGCGRGEWLELLRENGLTASGVDRDSMMVEMCRSRNLNVTENEALAHLKSLPDGSLGAVTSFHMVEHLAFDETLAFIDEALRVLKPGGLIILETPNPRILSVGAHTFWLDPTHRKPLPSLMLRFFVEARGFCDANVQELHPYPPGALFPDDGKGVTNRLNDLLYGPQDYAVIARKARLG